MDPSLDSYVATWDVETTAKQLYQALPQLREAPGEHALRAEALKELVSDRARKMNMTGPRLAQALRASSRPGVDLLQLEDMQELFGPPVIDYFRWSATGVRLPSAFIKTMLMKFLFSTMPVCIQKVVEEHIFCDKLIPKQRRDPTFDVWYPPTATPWMIRSGPETAMTYDSTVCRPGEGRKGIHGCRVSPKGWLRLAVHLAEDQRHVLKAWHQAYHGTHPKNVRSILGSGLCKPAKPLHGSAGSKKGQTVIYASPSLEYSAHFVYTDELEANAPEGSEEHHGPGSHELVASAARHVGSAVVEAEGQFVNYVFEVRVRPGSYRVQGNTLARSLWENWFIEYDTTTSSRNLEWLISNPEDIVVTGVMIRILPKPPREFLAEREQQMKEHVGWNPDTKCATRPRNYGGVEARGIGDVEWQWNNEPSDGHTLSYTTDNWVPYSRELSEVIESAYQDYQQFAFLGQPDGAPGPYFIDFGCEGDPNIEEGPEQRRADEDQAQTWRRRAIRRVARAAP